MTGNMDFFPKKIKYSFNQIKVRKSQKISASNLRSIKSYRKKSNMRGTPDGMELMMNFTCYCYHEFLTALNHLNQICIPMYNLYI